MTDASKGHVWAMHDFEAENPDEVSFKAGEIVIIVEKDDAYGDGWWQGTNTKGETGLFPFSYTTYDKALAQESAASAAGAPGVMGNTMADIDAAIANMNTNDSSSKGTPSKSSGIVRPTQGMDASRDSFASERSMSVGESDEGGDAEADLASRAKARAALAVNAARAAEDAEAGQRAEEARKRTEAARIFALEEERQREMLLAKEAERKRELEKGTLKEESKDDKVVPIEGVEMSDESDSEGSEIGGPTIHAPLLGGGMNSSQEPPARGLSPIASESGVGAGSAAALAAGAAAAAAGLVGASNSSRGYDENSIDSSRGGRASGTTDIVGAGTAPGTAATSIAGGMETPKSATTAGVGASPAASTNGAAAARVGPGGDPHEWTVEQVVEWGRAKGWDEAAVVSKFAEHEISGDVLMEMDVNILKEIDINTFGKRFQVANAIKDLKKSLGAPAEAAAASPAQALAVAPAAPWTPSAPASARATSPAPSSRSAQLGTQYVTAPLTAQHSGAAGMVPSLSAQPAFGARNGSLQQAGTETLRRPESDADLSGRQASSGALSPDLAGGWSRARAQTSGASDSGRHSIVERDLDFADEDQALASERKQRQVSQVSNVSQISSGAGSPRRRESAGSGREIGQGERTSFFAGLGQRSRKAPPKVATGRESVSNDEPLSGGSAKGTLGRLGLGRLRERSHQPEGAPGADALKGKISGPTSSPTYDSMGNTARRNRQSQQSGGSIGVPGGSPYGMGHGRQQSVGSAGQGASDWYGPNRNSAIEPRTSGGTEANASSTEGPVMARIRPVDLEGWMKKKGERYNSWKPRYLALKGSDLVLLRDPSAPKIKGYVSMKGYKVIADENTNPGKYGFKILHETEKPHYFSSDDPNLVRDWMKALMKSTIGRDNTLPVISSYNNATISLKEAQRMNPPPRPPSPTSRARAQRATARANKDQLTAKDASVLMGLGQPANMRQGMRDRSRSIASATRKSSTEIGLPYELAQSPPPPPVPSLPREEQQVWPSPASSTSTNLPRTHQRQNSSSAATSPAVSSELAYEQPPLSITWAPEPNLQLHPLTLTQPQKQPESRPASQVVSSAPPVQFTPPEPPQYSSRASSVAGTEWQHSSSHQPWSEGLVPFKVKQSSLARASEVIAVPNNPSEAEPKSGGSDATITVANANKHRDSLSLNTGRKPSGPRPQTSPLFFAEQQQQRKNSVSQVGPSNATPAAEPSPSDVYDKGAVTLLIDDLKSKARQDASPQMSPPVQMTPPIITGPVRSESPTALPYAQGTITQAGSSNTLQPSPSSSGWQRASHDATHESDFWLEPKEIQRQPHRMRSLDLLSSDPSSSSPKPGPSVGVAPHPRSASSSHLRPRTESDASKRAASMYSGGGQYATYQPHSWHLASDPSAVPPVPSLALSKHAWTASNLPLPSVAERSRSSSMYDQSGEQGQSAALAASDVFKEAPDLTRGSAWQQFSSKLSPKSRRPMTSSGAESRSPRSAPLVVRDVSFDVARASPPAWATPFAATPSKLGPGSRRPMTSSGAEGSSVPSFGSTRGSSDKSSEDKGSAKLRRPLSAHGLRTLGAKTSAFFRMGSGAEGAEGEPRKGKRGKERTKSAAPPALPTSSPASAPIFLGGAGTGVDSLPSPPPFGSPLPPFGNAPPPFGYAGGAIGSQKFGGPRSYQTSPKSAPLPSGSARSRNSQ